VGFFKSLAQAGIQVRGIRHAAHLGSRLRGDDGRSAAGSRFAPTPGFATLRAMSLRRRHRQRLLRDLDALHALAMALVVLVATGGLAYVAYAWHAWRVARCAGTRAKGTVLVFGKHCPDGAPDADFAARLVRAHGLAEEGDVARVLLLGGGDRPTEAEVAERALRARGWPAAVPLVLEDQSRDTLENLRHAHRLLGDAAEPVWLLSNRYHLARCALLAEGIGLRHALCAAEDRLRLHPILLLEAGLLMWIDIGRRWALLIRHRRMAARLGPEG
jgi:uncharacterized SAM-binding protein YcdF (DUF218 family)